MSDTGDQTEAELEKTRQVVAASMAEQIAANDAAANDAVEEASAPDDELEQARADAEAAGVDVDGRWGVDRLRDEIAAAQKSTKSKKEA